MNPRIKVLLGGEYVLGLIDGKEMLAAGRGWEGRYYICSSCTVPGNFELALLYAECVKAVVRKCRELQNIQE